MVIKWFIDDLESPFSLHRLVKIGAAMGKKPGDWYGPATVAHVLTQALSEAFVDNPILENITTYVAQDCTVYIDDVIKMCTMDNSSRRRISVSRKEARSRASSVSSASCSSAFEAEMAKIAIEEQLRQELIREKSEEVASKSSASRTRASLLAAKASSTINLYDSVAGSEPGYNNVNGLNGTSSSSRLKLPKKEEKWRGVVIFIPVRLGGEKFNPIYSDCVKNLFSQPTSLGESARTCTFGH